MGTVHFGLISKKCTRKWKLTSSVCMGLLMKVGPNLSGLLIGVN